MKNRFVYCICGDNQVATLNWSLRFLRAFSNAEIVVYACRTSEEIRHAAVVKVDAPCELSDHQASIYLKTSLPSLCAVEGYLNCYLDSDQIAISTEVDRVFDFYSAPITFALDHGKIERFSHSALACGCPGACPHLREALADKFKVIIDDPNWRHWNGGLFLFDQASAEFARLWHEYTLLIFEDPLWRVRDQATLIATVWTLGLENHATVPSRFNFIVDRFMGIAEALRPGLREDECTYVETYDLHARGSEAPAFLHMINGGVGKTGWRNWDELYEYMTLQERSNTRRRPGAIHA